MTALSHFVRPDGSYWGQSDTVPEGCISVPTGPAYASQTWDGTEWSDPGPGPVPAAVSAFQAKAALTQAGLYDKAAAAAQAAGGFMFLAWSTATEFERSSPNIATLAAGLGLTDAQVDDLFRAASKITA